MYLRDKDSATKDALAQGAAFSSDDTARWNAQIKSDNPKEFTQAAAKAASLSKATPAKPEAAAAPAKPEAAAATITQQLQAAEADATADSGASARA